MNYRKTRIVATNAEYSEASRPIEVIANGIKYTIKPGEETDVPEVVTNILLDSSYVADEPNDDGHLYKDGKFVGKRVTKRRYNVVVLSGKGRPSEKDIAAQRRMAALQKKAAQATSAEEFKKIDDDMKALMYPDGQPLADEISDEPEGEIIDEPTDEIVDEPEGENVSDEPEGGGDGTDGDMTLTEDDETGEGGIVG